MSLVYFEENFEELATSELANIERYSCYYRSKEAPDSVMHFKISSTGLAAALIHPLPRGSKTNRGQPECLASLPGSLVKKEA